MNKAVQDGRIRCFDMLEGPADGDQDLKMWTRLLEDVVREIMEDHVFKGNQNFSFEMDVPPDQYAVESAALADRNFNVPCETGIRYPSLISMINRRDMLWQPTVLFSNVNNLYTFTYYIHVYTFLYLYIHGTYSDYHLLFRQTTKTRRVVCALMSTSSNQAESSLCRIQHPL